MSFSATKRELGELYTFFRLLADGNVSLGTPSVELSDVTWPVAMIQRMEHDGARRYYIEEKQVRIVYGEVDKHTGKFSPKSDIKEVCFPREEFADASAFVWTLMKEGRPASDGSDGIEVPDELEAFLDEVRIYDLEAKTEDRTDFSVAFWHPDAPLTGFNVRCRLSPMNPLLDGGRTANLKFEQTGVKFAVPTVNKVNALPESPTEVTERMLLIERLGGVLKYADVADKVFRSNLLMIDLHFPRMLAEMVRALHLEGISRVSELTEYIKQLNPLKIKDELIHKHHYYEHKMKQFLLALALGMRPAKIYNGTDSAVEGILFVDAKGQVLCYHNNNRQVLADFLYQNTRFEKGNVDKDKYGFLERENGVYYFKLNVKIGLLKR
ncbi:MAG: HpaII family restriction endonuclease [Bacteroides sp.]|nr:HpaII family restriction endonuclease [Bacteroides sp.]